MKSRSSVSRGTAYKRKPAASKSLFDAFDEHDIEAETPLLPELIAESVIGEVERCVGRRLPDAWIRHLAERAARCYNGNDQFRRRLNRPGNECREWLYAFMRHWITGLLENFDAALLPRLPYGFSIGRKLQNTRYQPR